jgi:3-deoxy-D-manno-octulosonate 8-phosphate phosphatase (KDO 8-P phosphatase)
VEKNIKLKNIMYVGNDLNDLLAMNLCGYTACPSDSHSSIKLIADVVLKEKGGNGVIRELLEGFFKIDLLRILYK